MLDHPILVDRAPVGHGLDRPKPESARRRLLVRAVSLTALAVSAAYLTWRATATINISVWWVALPLLLFEIHNTVGLAIYTFSTWDIDAGPPWRAVDTSPHRLAVLIPTYDEGAEVLIPTVTAALNIQPAHETWVLDDGNRPEVARLADDLGARYLSRPHNIDAKAGNLNNALEHVEADLIAVLDADHVPRTNFLRHTLAYFDDPEVAVVQTPQDFYNQDSFEHQVRRSGRVFNEEAVFYRVMLPGKNRWNAAFWCGTGALVRVEALRAVGGVATGTVTEDIHTSIRLHSQGWKIVAHNEVLALGLAPADANQYLLQRRRWSQGAMQVARKERLLANRRLTFAQRLAYGATLFAWFDAWRSLGYVLLPMLVLATGRMPIDASLSVFAPFFLAALGSQFIALRFLARGYYPPILSTIFETARMPAVLKGTLALFRPDGNAKFRVTPKGRVEEPSRRVPVLLWALTAGVLLAATWAGLTAAEVTPLHYSEPGAMAGTMVFLALNAGFMVAAITRMRSARFAGEKRASVRFPSRLPAIIEGNDCTVVDLSLNGARVVAEGQVELSDSPTIVIDITSRQVTLPFRVARRQETEGRTTELGIEFDAPDALDKADLALHLFHPERQPDYATAV